MLSVIRGHNNTTDNDALYQIDGFYINKKV